MGDIYTNPPQSRNEAILKATIDGTEYTAPPQSRIEDLLVELKQAIEGGSVSSYNDLTDKPSINGVTLSGNKTTEDLHILQGEVPYLLSDVSDVSIVADGTTITIAWTDPNDIMDGSTVVTAWAGTKVVRKAGSAPENVFDGTVVVDSKTKNQYASSGYADTNLAVGTYYYRFFPYSENGVYTQGQYGSGTAEIPIYGAEWDGTSSQAWTRTDAAANFADPNPYYASMADTPSSPFDNISPWKDMEIVEDASAGSLVKIPKFYYKLTKNGDAMKLQISMDQKDGFSCSPAHMDRGDGNGERDIIYVGRYHCATTTYKSTTGVAPINNITRETARTSIHNLGSNVWQFDYATFWTIAMLYLVEYANWNEQTKIGYGGGNNSPSGIKNNGQTDSMPYHTGTVAQTRDAYGCVQYRHIENMWSNLYTYYDGLYSKSVSLGGMPEYFAIKNPSEFSDTTGGVSLGRAADSNTTSSNICIINYSIPQVTGYEYMIMPIGKKQTFSNDQYIGDTMNYPAYASDVSPTYSVLYGGMHYGQLLQYGLFRVTQGRNNNTGNVDTGCRLMKLQNNS